MNETNKCHCIIKHPDTPEERKQFEDALEYARRVNDLQALPLLLAQLTGECQSKKKE